MPKLFIRGSGGSIKIDLLGIGVNLSEGAFAHLVADESLNDLHIHRGDIAVVDPARSVLKIGNLILLELPGRGGVLRQLTKNNGVWYLSSAESTNPESFPLIDQPMHGVVVGFLRLLTRMKPVNYRGTEANFAPPKERSRATMPLSERQDKTSSKSRSIRRSYPKGKRIQLILAAEKKPPYPSPRASKKSQPR